MIRFPNRIKYGLQFMLFLTVDDEEFTGIQRAAISCEIPQKFLEAIAVDLKKLSLLEVKRGAGGGYRIVRNLSDITLADIVKALSGDENKPYPINGDLISQTSDKILQSVYDSMWENWTLITLKDIQKQYLESAEKLMYYI